MSDNIELRIQYLDELLEMPPQGLPQACLRKAGLLKYVRLTYKNHLLYYFKIKFKQTVK